MNPDTGPDPLPYLLEAVVGAAIGAFIAVTAGQLTKRPIRVLPDILLGVAGYLGGAVGTAHIPWRLNTISYRVGNAVIRSTSKHYQYPYRVAFVLAVLLPVVFETIRFLRGRKTS
jgi:hypothetical protein